jgi:hypothetical protein
VEADELGALDEPDALDEEYGAEELDAGPDDEALLLPDDDGQGDVELDSVDEVVELLDPVADDADEAEEADEEAGELALVEAEDEAGDDELYTIELLLLPYDEAKDDDGDEADELEPPVGPDPPPVEVEVVVVTTSLVEVVVAGEVLEAPQRVGGGVGQV